MRTHWWLASLLVVALIVAFARARLADHATDHTRLKSRIPAEYEQMRNIGESQSPYGLDSLEAKITLLAKNEDQWKVRIDRVPDPYIKSPTLRKDDELYVYISGFIEHYATAGKVGYDECSLKQSSATANATRPLPKLIAGDKWFAYLYKCHSSSTFVCKKEGWWAYLYTPGVTILEYVCGSDTGSD